uniref:Secretory protein 28B03 n=1 Tax=Heterodera glycines TaxID=51029 RepID=A0A7D6DK70_HETGL|nr:secretory protein 28B03 [Heterodera glycines]
MNILLKSVLFISLLSLFGDCMKNSDQIGVKRKSAGIRIEEPNDVKGKGKVVETSRKGKEKVGEKISVMNTAERIEKMDLAQDKAKMDIDTNGKPKQNEENAPPKYVFIWSGNNEKKNLEVDLRVIRHSKKTQRIIPCQK